MVESDAVEVQPRLHRVQWTPEKVARFWTWYADGLERGFFGTHFSAAVVAFARNAGGLTPPARLADIGAGQGDLLEILLAEGFTCVGFEISGDASGAIDARLAGRPGFEGMRVGGGEALPAEAAEFDGLFALEVIEHLLDAQVEPFFAEAFRVLRPGGLLVLSTPNAERLTATEVVCPDCGGVFHPVQHLQSWDRDRLAATVRETGFEPVAVQETRLFTSRLDAFLAGVADRVKRSVGLRKERLRPNLLFACRRPADPSRPRGGDATS